VKTILREHIPSVLSKVSYSVEFVYYFIACKALGTLTHFGSEILDPLSNSLCQSKGF
jgi:hypothetical protein